LIPNSTRLLSVTDTKVRRPFKDPHPPDFTINCGARNFRVHKAVIAAHSEYFKAACAPGKFMVGIFSQLLIHDSLVGTCKLNV
jgi:hypothetical protein